MTRRTIPLVAHAALLNAACDQRTSTAPDLATPGGIAPVSAHAHAVVEPSPDARQQLAALHPLFAKSHDRDTAVADGYKFVGPCVSDRSLGGMGDHYSLNADVDFGRGDGTYTLERPQYLVYAPQNERRLQVDRALVA